MLAQIGSYFATIIFANPELSAGAAKNGKTQRSASAPSQAAETFAAFADAA